MMNRLRQLMYGRYGNDQLNLALVIFGCVITLILSFFGPYVRLIGTLPYIIAFLRAFSKKHEKRRKENVKFLQLSEPWRKYIVKKVNQFRDKDHKYYDCPQCHNTLRVPKGRGKIKISCPHCSKKFIRKT